MPTIQLPKQICSQPFGMDALSIVREIIDDGQKEGIHPGQICSNRKQLNLQILLCRRNTVNQRVTNRTN